VKAFSTVAGKRLRPEQLAETAYRVESEKLGRPCGKQDQYAAAFGGLNSIYFQREGVRVVPLSVDASTREQLRERLLLFFLGSSREESTIAFSQQQGPEKNDAVMSALHRLKTARG
jgi:D-glycero-alpha-D-manno-heptose-7-phosphate kinase